MEKDEQRYVMKFFFLRRKKSNTRHEKLPEALEEAALSRAMVERWCRRFKQANFSLDEESRPGRPLSDIDAAVSQFLKKEPFLSAHTFAKRLAIRPYTIKEILTRDLGMRKLMR
jgi:hypothetical protein